MRIPTGQNVPTPGKRRSFERRLDRHAGHRPGEDVDLPLGPRFFLFGRRPFSRHDQRVVVIHHELPCEGDVLLWITSGLVLDEQLGFAGVNVWFRPTGLSTIATILLGQTGIGSVARQISQVGAERLEAPAGRRLCGNVNCPWSRCPRARGATSEAVWTRKI